MSKRICIRAWVQDIPGNPLARASTLAELFCQDILQRPFRRTMDLEGYDYCHILPGFDSLTPKKVWFILDLDVKGELTREQLKIVPHFVYLATVQRTGELEFIPRDDWKEGAKERAKMYVSGGREKQERLRATRESEEQSS